MSASAGVLQETSIQAPEREPHTAPLWLILSAFAAVYLIWGSTYLGIRIAIDTIPPMLMAGARFLFAGLLLYGIMRARGASRPRATHWKSAAGVGTLLLLGGNGGVTWAQQTVPSGVAALMVAAVALWMILIDWMRPNGVRPRVAVFCGLLLGFVGVAVIVSGKTASGAGVIPFPGAIVLLIAPFCWALGSVYSRHAEQHAEPLLNVAMQMITGGAALLLVGVVLGEVPQLNLSTISARSAWAFLYLTLVGSLVGFTAYVWLLQVSTPARVATYAYVNPFIAVVLGWFVLGEKLPSSVLLAGCLIVAAVALITTAKHRAA